MAFLGVFGALGFGRFGYSAILPSMQEGLGITSAAAGSLASWNLGGYTLMAAGGGLLAARFGSRRVVTAGLAITSAGMLLTGLSHSLVTASVGRFITGLGNGMVLVPSIALMASWFEKRRLGFASSVVSSGSSLALVLVGLAVPRIISGGEADTWRLAWYFFAGASICLAILNVFVQRDRPHAALSGRSAFGPDELSRASLRTTAGNTILSLGRILRSRYTWHLGIVYLLYGAAFLVYLTFFQKRLTIDLSYTSEVAGYLFLIVGLGGVLGGALWGSMSDCVGRGQTLAVMCLAQAVAAAFFALWPTMPALVVSAFICGLAGMSVPGVVGAGCGDQFGPILAPAALGFVTIFMGVGMALGPYLAGYVADKFGSLEYSYVLAAGVFVLAAVPSFFLRETGSCGDSRPLGL